MFTLIENCSRNVFGNHGNTVTVHGSLGKERDIMGDMSWCLRMFVYSRSTYGAESVV